MNYEALFVDPTGRTSREQYVGGLITLLAALAFYYLLVLGPSGRIGMLVMLYPAVVLHARRLHDMGQNAWLLVVPVALVIGAHWLRTSGSGPATQTQMIANVVAFVVCAGFVLRGLAVRGKRQAPKMRGA